MKTLLIAALLAATSLGVTTGCAVMDGQSSVGQKVDDAAVATRVKAKFAADSGVSASRIQVEVLNGTVQLAGFATSQAEKDKAASLARATPDVKNVVNNIIVRPAQ